MTEMLYRLLFWTPIAEVIVVRNPYTTYLVEQIEFVPPKAVSGQFMPTENLVLSPVLNTMPGALP